RPLAASAESDALSVELSAGVPSGEAGDDSLSSLAETASRLDDGDRADVLYELLLTYADRVAISYPEISIGPVSRYLGVLASTTARWDDAERHFGRAIELSARIGARPSLAHTQADYARVLIERGDADGGATALAAALAAYQ